VTDVHRPTTLPRPGRIRGPDPACAGLSATARARGHGDVRNGTTPPASKAYNPTVIAQQASARLGIARVRR
jgi:hypothetical protein